MNSRDFSMSICRLIFQGMGADYEALGSAAFSLDDDQWRILIGPIEPRNLSISFDKRLDRDEVAWIAMRFNALASAAGLRVVHVGTHKQGDLHEFDNTCALDFYQDSQ